MRSKVLNVHRIRSVLIVKLKTKNDQKKDVCEYKLNSGSKGILISIRMYKMLFSNTNIHELNKAINKTSVACL